MGFKSVSHLYSKVIVRIGGDKYRGFILLYQCWKDVVGELLAAKSYPCRFQKGVLYVAVQNNSWLQELFLHKQSILEACKAKTKEEIKEIIFLIRS